MNISEEGKAEDKSGINGVTLSPGMMTALFAEVLVPLAAPSPVPEPRKKPAVSPVRLPEPVSVVSLGKNRRNICLLVSVPGKDVLPAGTRAFLEKMLLACQLGIDDLAIVNSSLTPVSVPELVTLFSPAKWLIAGLSPASVGIDVPETHFEVIQWQGSQVLFLPALAEVDQETPPARQLKRQLWSGLQKLFGL